MNAVVQCVGKFGDRVALEIVFTRVFALVAKQAGERLLKEKVTIVARPTLIGSGRTRLFGLLTRQILVAVLIARLGLGVLHIHLLNLIAYLTFVYVVHEHLDRPRQEFAFVYAANSISNATRNQFVFEEDILAQLN